MKRICKGIIICFAAISCNLNCIYAQKFTIAVLPDTQNEVQRNFEMFTSQLKWIVDKKDSLNIPIVLHVGDMVNTSDTLQWQRASEGFKILDKVNMPYVLAVGNHDAEVFAEKKMGMNGSAKENIRKTSKLNKYFPVERFTNSKGQFEKGKSDNAFYIFNAGGLDWMVLSLEYCARVGVVRWADKVIAEHPNHNVILLTHYHLNPSGDISERADYGELSPQEIYDMLIKKYRNVLLVLSGHTGSSSWRNDKGDHGNRIYQILQDYQGENSGDGYIRLLEINPERKTIYGKVYSPFSKKEKKEASIWFLKVDFTLPKLTMDNK